MKRLKQAPRAVQAAYKVGKKLKGWPRNTGHLDTMAPKTKTCKLEAAGVPEGMVVVVKLAMVKDKKRYEQITSVRRTGSIIKTVGKIRVDVTQYFEEYIEL